MELQNKFENREITISELTTSQIDSLKEEVDADLIGVSTIDEVIGRLVFRK